MKLSTTLLLGSTLLMSVQASQAAIALDRTRANFDGEQKSISLNIRNDNTHLPYLAQSWLEDKDHNKVSSPLMVVPPVQRVEPGAKSQIRVTGTPELAKLPQDRESMFYFNVREIPPRSDKPNVMQIALQTKIKLFYRPKAIEAAMGDVWQEKLVMHKTAGGYLIENPTPYFVTLINIAGKPHGESSKNFKSVMIAPQSSEQVTTATYDVPYVTYVNDFGGRPELKFSCSGAVCNTVANKA